VLRVADSRSGGERVFDPQRWNHGGSLRTTNESRKRGLFRGLSCLRLKFCKSKSCWFRRNFGVGNVLRVADSRSGGARVCDVCDPQRWNNGGSLRTTNGSRKRALFRGLSCLRLKFCKSKSCWFRRNFGVGNVLRVTDSRSGGARVCGVCAWARRHRRGPRAGKSQVLESESARPSACFRTWFRVKAVRHVNPF